MVASLSASSSSTAALSNARAVALKLRYPSHPPVSADAATTGPRPARLRRGARTQVLPGVEDKHQQV